MTNRKPKPSLVSMFSGCGGLDIGFEQAGFDVKWANDINVDAVETYRHNIGEIILDDITNLQPPCIDDLDVLAAGFPCQPFSNAGKRLGTKDHRGSLYLESLRFIDTLKPKFALLENVRGILSIKEDGDYILPKIVADLDKLGYRTSFDLINASSYGVPQNRLRVIIVAARKDILASPFEFPEFVEEEDLSIGGTILNIRKNARNQKELLKLNPQAIEIGKMVPEGGSWKSIPYEKLPPRLQRIRDDMRKYRWPNFYRRFHRDEISGTITAAFKPENAGVWHPVEDRVMSVREIARIQTFPDSYFFKARSIKAKYEMIGNAIPPKLAKVFASDFKKLLEGKRRTGRKPEAMLENKYGQGVIKPNSGPHTFIQEMRLAV